MILDDLADTEVADEIGQALRDVRIIALLCNQCESSREDVVAREDGHLVVPARIGRRRTAARIRLIDDIVMDQRCRVDELKRLCQRQDMRQVKGSAAASRQQAERRTDALPARRHDVHADFRYQVIRGSHGLLQALLQYFKIALYDIKHLV